MLGIGALMFITGFVAFLIKGDGMRTGSWAYVEQDGISFRYPEVFQTSYVYLQAWPPAARVIEGPLVCTRDGSEREGEVGTRTIGKRVYCVSEFVSAAAGSTYKEYSYSTETRKNNVIVLTFSIRTPDCANYDEREQLACRREQQNFDMDPVIDRIIDTI